MDWVWYTDIGLIGIMNKDFMNNDLMYKSFYYYCAYCDIKEEFRTFYANKKELIKEKKTGIIGPKTVKLRVGNYVVECSKCKKHSRLNISMCVKLKVSKLVKFGEKAGG